MAQAAMAAVLSAVFMRIRPPLGAGMLPAFGGNQCPRKAPVAVTGVERAVGFFERMDLDLAETEPLEQRRQVHAGERLHERLIVPPRMAEMDPLIERLGPGQE